MNAPPFELRRADPADAAGMVAVHYAAVHGIAPGHYPDAILSSWSPVPDEQRRGWLADFVASPSTVADVAVAASGAVVGFCIATLDPPWLRALYVDPGYSGQGVGRSLLHAIESRCRAAGLGTLELNASYNAAAFYRAHGYVEVRDTTQALPDGAVMGAILMAKTLAVGS